jgi:hypothetical protein
VENVSVQLRPASAAPWVWSDNGIDTVDPALAVAEPKLSDAADASGMAVRNASKPNRRLVKEQLIILREHGVTASVSRAQH